jgi:hypothetical protein
MRDTDEERRVLREKAKLAETSGISGTVIQIEPDAIASAVAAAMPGVPQGLILCVLDKMEKYLVTCADLHIEASREAIGPLRMAEQIAHHTAMIFQGLVYDSKMPHEAKLARSIAEHTYALSYASRKDAT